MPPLPSAARFDTDVFTGRIAGFGTTSGVRFVVGLWASSPFGAVTDVMVETVDGHRTLLAPTAALADYIAETYTFDEVRVLPVTRRATAAWVAGGADLVTVEAGRQDAPDPDEPGAPGGLLRLELEVGGRPGLGRLLRAVPRGMAVRPAWLRLIDPVAAFLQPGVSTAGTAGGGRREYYGVTDVRAIDRVEGRWGPQELGAVAPLTPPVRFGFASAPAAPSIVEVTTTIRRPRTRV